MTPHGVFVTGTDTGVGKTRVASALVRLLRTAGHDAVGFKPIVCGDSGDADALHLASGGDAVVSRHEVNPLWLRPPAAPYAAAAIEGRPVDLATIRDAWRSLATRHAFVVVEGAGGWRVPVLRDHGMDDLAAEMSLPVLIVVANRLGCLNHALLTLDAVRARRLPCPGFVLNHPAPPGSDEDLPAQATNRAVLEDVSGLPVLAELAHDADDAALAAVLKSLLPRRAVQL